MNIRPIKFISILLLLTLRINSGYSQSNCINDSILFVTNSANWLMTSNSFGVPSNVNAFIAAPQLNSITGFSSAQWINYQISWTMNGIFNQPDDSAIFRYDFSLCQNDSITLNFHFRRDNYCTIILDGNIIYTEPPTAATNNYYVGDNYLNTFYLSQGVHHFDFVNYNTYPYTGANGVGFIIGGYIISKLNSLILNLPGCANASCCTSSPPLQITGDTSICQGNTATLTASGAANYSWSGGITNGVSFTPGATTTYTVTGADANGCTNTSSIIVNVKPSPSVTASVSPSSVCPGNPVTLAGSGALSYLWSGGISNGIPFVPSSTATYTVTGTDANNCTNTSSITVNVVNNLNISISPSNPILCLGDSVQLTASGGVNYIWSPINNINAINISNPIVFPTSTSTYVVTGTDATGCTGTSSLTIEIISDPKLLVSKSGDVECNIHNIQLSATGASSYSWSPATWLSAPNSSVTNAMVNVPTTFVVIGAVGTCSITDSIHIDVYNNDEAAINIPNAFTPNGDGKNDCLRVLNKANFKDYYFAIYNRWGQQVFESDNPLDCWDGSFKNQRVKPDTYYYFLKGETSCGKVFKKGDITVVY